MKSAYERPKDADDRIESAILIIESLLRMKDRLHKPMLEKFISNCLWWVTEAEGKSKYEIQYRSKESLKYSPKDKQWRHEHVYRRNDMVQQLLKDPNNVRSIVKDAVGCVVSIDEHQRLGQVDREAKREKIDLDGWSRYKKAGIEVIDMKSGTQLTLSDI